MTAPFYLPRISALPLLLFLAFLAGCGVKMSDEVTQAYKDLPEVIDYNTDIKPIVSDRCYHCHGPDENKREANVRLDQKDGLFKVSNSGNSPFVSGNISQSEAIKRILSDDPETMMPPPNSNRTLSAQEKAALVKWVENGAEWKEHWAYLPPEKSKLPKSDASWAKSNEIDHFVQSRLKIRNLSPAPKAEKEQLIRRITMDLTGLPPTIQAIDAFLEDTSPGAYEKVVDQLLKTTAHSERMTLEWLDLARYADSHGFHADGARTMWPWRDWVIKAFESNMPYDQFVSEQIAGDLMPNATKDQIVATAFNRNHPMTAEGGAVVEEFRLEYVANRTNTIGTAFMGLTLECAKCHDHKFDPISQEEYYQVSSFFNNVKELGMTGDDGNYGPMVMLSDVETDAILDFLDKDLAKLEGDREQLLMNNKEEKTLQPLIATSFETITTTKEGRYFGKNKNLKPSKQVELGDGVWGKAPIFDEQEDRLLIEDFGQFEAYEPFTISLWVKIIEETNKTKVLIGNAGEKNNLWRGWDLYLDSTNHISFRLISTLPHNFMQIRTAESVDVGEWAHIVAAYDGSMKAEGVEITLNGNTADARVEFDRLYKSILPTNTSRTSENRPLQLGKSYRLYTGDNGILKGALDELAVYGTALSVNDAKALYERSQLGQKATIKAPSNAQLSKLNSQLSELRQKKMKVIDTIPELMVMEEMPKRRPTFVLDRGEYDKPTNQVEPGSVKKVLPFGSNYEKNRLGLTKWLFDKDNPLTARVAVNRYWQMIFGQGIVATVNDFGSQGALPSHPKLLDWLAVDFVASGWDLRALIKTMVMSETYQQSSKINSGAYEADPSNKWLARGASYRWQAEFIRDNALASSGLLINKKGGPSTKPHQPDGLWIELGNFSHFLRTYQRDKDENQYRRSMYTFIRRTSPPPNMTLFDAPNREVCTVTRERTNTPLQALVLLNDPQFVEASKALAYRLQSEVGGSVEQQIETGFRMVLSRRPSEKEKAIFEDLYAQELAEFKKDKTRVDEFLGVGDFSVEVENPTALAALTIVSNTLLNMDEAYTKR